MISLSSIDDNDNDDDSTKGIWISLIVHKVYTDYEFLNIEVMSLPENIAG